MATIASPDSSQSLMAFECAEVTSTNGPHAGEGALAKNATKKCPVGVGSATVPIPAGALRISTPLR